jgi:ketosteroid isomerase-like protein
VTGAAAIQRFWQGVMDAGIGAATLETLEVRAGGDLAYEVGRYTLRAKSGEVADAGKYLVIWRNDGGGWKLYRDIWTTSRPVA